MNWICSSIFMNLYMLALPIKRVHPDDREGNSTCDPVMLKKLEELIIDEEPRMIPDGMN